MKSYIKVGLVLSAIGIAGASAQARVHPQMYCWTPDVEFAVACEEEEDEEEPGFINSRP
jgi:hypothetical protein